MQEPVLVDGGGWSRNSGWLLSRRRLEYSDSTFSLLSNHAPGPFGTARTEIQERAGPVLIIMVAKVAGRFYEEQLLTPAPF